MPFKVGGCVAGLACSPAGAMKASCVDCGALTCIQNGKWLPNPAACIIWCWSWLGAGGKSAAIAWSTSICVVPFGRFAKTGTAAAAASVFALLYKDGKYTDYRALERGQVRRLRLHCDLCPLVATLPTSVPWRPTVVLLTESVESVLVRRLHRSPRG